jgi:hypothetical protein
MALGLTQPVKRNAYQRSSLEGKGGQCLGLITLPPSCVNYLKNPGSLNLLEPSGPAWAYNGITLFLPSLYTSVSQNVVRSSVINS